MGLGKKLDILIKVRGRKVNDVAKAADIPSSTVYSMIKRDNTKADLNDLHRLAEELNVTLEYFVGGSENNPPSLNSDDEQWTDEERIEIANFKRFLKSKRNG